MVAKSLVFPRPAGVLKRAALLHDIGKLGVSNQILDKAGKLDHDEWQAVRLHPVQGNIILSRIDAFEGLARVARDHHEKLDGSGYPNGISGDASRWIRAL